LTYDPSTATAPLRVIMVAPVSVPPAEQYERGIAVVLLHASRPTDDERASGAKASNYLANLLAVYEAKQKGAQEALMIGPSGQILEGASSNLFIVKDGKVRTPEPHRGRRGRGEAGRPLRRRRGLHHQQHPRGDASRGGRRADDRLRGPWSGHQTAPQQLSSGRGRGNRDGRLTTRPPRTKASG
ncbi:MAG: aminotransferase class IV, partial [Deltaproteobacteria bacterium]|nr:aminotransferase class IV [Deltaproteobacteria bacterium]